MHGRVISYEHEMAVVPFPQSSLRQGLLDTGSTSEQGLVGTNNSALINNRDFSPQLPSRETPRSALQTIARLPNVTQSELQALKRMNVRIEAALAEIKNASHSRHRVALRCMTMCLLPFVLLVETILLIQAALSSAPESPEELARDQQLDNACRQIPGDPCALVEEFFCGLAQQLNNEVKSSHEEIFADARLDRILLWGFFIFATLSAMAAVWAKRNSMAESGAADIIFYNLSEINPNTVKVLFSELNLTFDGEMTVLDVTTALTSVKADNSRKYKALYPTLPTAQREQRFYTPPSAQPPAETVVVVDDAKEDINRQLPHN